MVTAQALSQLDQEEFVAALDGLYEHSPWVAQRAWRARPFASRTQLFETLCGVLREASGEELMKLVRAHPELAGKAAVRGELTEESTREQASARLDACTLEEFERLQQLNAAYQEKFGFPFIIAVRGLDRAKIIAHFSARLNNDSETEFREALRQIERIAALRLEERVTA